MSNHLTPAISREAQCLQAWMLCFPTATIERLCNINSSTGSAKHVVMSLGYGIYDKNIAAINRTIVRLLLNRMRAEKNGNEIMIKRIQNILAGVHYAIDSVTGKSQTVDHVDSEMACRSPNRTLATSKKPA